MLPDFSWFIMVDIIKKQNKIQGVAKMEIIKKLTKKTVEGIKPDPLKELFVWDSELKGFGLRVFPTGRRTYFLQYRIHLAVPAAIS